MPVPPFAGTPEAGQARAPATVGTGSRHTPVARVGYDRRDVYRIVTRIATTAGIPRHISPHSLRHAAITNTLDAQ